MFLLWVHELNTVENIWDSQRLYAVHSVQWIEKKKKDFMKYRGMTADEVELEEEEEDEEEEEETEQEEEYPFLDDLF